LSLPVLHFLPGLGRSGSDASRLFKEATLNVTGLTGDEINFWALGEESGMEGMGSAGVEGAMEL